MGRSNKPKKTTASTDGVAKTSESDPPAPPPQAFDIFHKTKMCKFFIMGMCTRGESCQYAHSKEDLTPLPDLKCTKLCSQLIETGQCRDPACSFAHTRQELRVSATCRNRRQALVQQKDAKAKSRSEGSSSSLRGTFRGTPQTLRESKHLQVRLGATSECSTAVSSYASNCDDSSEVMPNIPISRSCFYAASESGSSASEFNPSEAAGTSFCSSLAPTSFCSSIQENEVETFTDKFKKMFWKRNQDDEAEEPLGGLRVSVKNTFLDFQDDETAAFKGLRKSCSAEGRLDLVAEDSQSQDSQ